MKKTKFVAVAAAAVMAVSAVGALAGCGTDEAHTISVLLLADLAESQFYMDYFEDVAKRLTEDLGEKYVIDFDYAQESDYTNKVDTAFTGGTAPDIFYVRPNDLLRYKNRIVSLQDYADHHATENGVNLNDVYAKALDMYRFDPATGRLGNSNDDLYAFPKDLSCQQLGYNIKLLREYRGVFDNLGLKYPCALEASTPAEKIMDFSRETYTWTQYKNLCKGIHDAAVAKNGAKNDVCASDVPNLEVVVKSFGGDLIDLSGGRESGKVTKIDEGPVAEAIDYLVDLVDCGAADHRNATYANFTSGKVVFYGEVGSWQISQYDSYIGDGDWGVMPWPTTDGSPNWQGRLTSAGYAVTTSAVENGKGDIAMSLAISFMSTATQDLMAKDYKVSIPLLNSMQSNYLDPELDNVYHPVSRKYFMEVISGTHGFTPKVYETLTNEWLSVLSEELSGIYKDGNPNNKLASWKANDRTRVYNLMQSRYDASVNQYV